MTGEYEHGMDEKGRLFIPARLREALGEGFYICKGLDNCLFLYSHESWQKLEERISAMPLVKSRQMQRLLYPTAMRCEPDSQGRILISQKLRDYAELCPGQKKNISIVGVGNHAEIWDGQRWAAQNEALTSETLEEAMSLLDF